MSTAQAKRELAVGVESAGLRMTPAEFEAIEDCDENYRYELVNGVLVVLAIPLPEETGPNELLGILLYLYQTDKPHGKSLDYTLPQQYVRTRTSRRIADRLIWTGLGRMPNVRRDVASIAVEFVSEGRRDRQRDYVDKRRDYHEAGLSEYWIIDRFERTLTVIHYRGKRSRQQIVKEGQHYESPLLPGFVVPLDKLWAAADRLAEAE
jgi:Uma2 family endonuclease